MNRTIVVAMCFALSAACAALIVANALQRRAVRRGALRQVGYSSREHDDDRAHRVVRLVPVVVAIAIAALGAVSVGPAGASAGLVPIVVGRSRARKGIVSRREAIEYELAPALQLVVGQLRIGRNIVAAISEVSETVPDPLGGILRDVVSEARLGTPIDEVLQIHAQREGDRHLGVVASAISLHARHGGSLVEILETVSDTIEEEDRLRRDIKSVTADGRLSAMVLMGMPPVMLLLVSLLSPGYASPLVNDPVGRMMAIVGITLGLIGWKWLRSLSAPQVVA